MGWKTFATILFVLLAITLIVFYWFSPTTNLNFGSNSFSNHNFTIGNSSGMQFYPNMRFPAQLITYKIDNCPLKRKNDMEQAFLVMSEKTILDFELVDYNENIYVTCNDEVKNEGGLFIAGEGGPVNITKTNLFNVIFTGKILLIKDSNCPEPNIAIHELLHVLGFEHSDNKGNIMYPVSDCNQVIGDDMITSINELYKTSSYPDLAFENVSANIDGKYLDSTIVVRNNGLKSSLNSNLLIYADEELVKSFDIKSLDVGVGMEMSLSNVWVSKRNPSSLKFVINNSEQEISKINNEMVLSAF
jgi:hypothetical protein